MKFNLHVEGTKLTEDQADIAEKKLEVLHKYSQKITEEQLNIDLRVVYNDSLQQDEKYKLRALLSVPGASFMAEAQVVEFEDGVDALHEKLQRQIERFKAKFMRMHKKNVVRDMQVDGDVVHGSLSEEDGLDDRVTKRKLFNNLVPMTEKEAIDNMEMIGHGFFLFVNAATDRYNMVYKRPTSGGYGVIELEHEVGILQGK